MEQGKLSDPLKSIIEEFKSYVENLLTYNKLLFVKGASELSSYMLLLIVLFGISGFVLLFFSFAFAGWFGQITGWGIGAGYLLVAIIYLILAYLVFHFRKPLIFNPTRKVLGEIFFAEFESDEVELNFSSADSHAETLKQVHETLKAQKVELNNKITDFEKKFTFTNIIQEILGKAYSSIMTTSNIAKFVYTIIRQFKRSKKKKSIKKLKGKNNNEETKKD